MGKNAQSQKLKKAVEIIINYFQAVSMWVLPPANLENEKGAGAFLLIRTLSKRYLAKEAMRYISNRRRLQNFKERFSQVEKILERQIDKIKPQIDLLQQEAIISLNQAAFDMDRIERCYLKKSEWRDEGYLAELEKLQIDTLLQFTDLTLVCDELYDIGLSADFASFIDRVARLEMKLDKIHGCFHEIVLYLPNIKDLLFGIERWWLEPPEKNEYERYIAGQKLADLISVVEQDEPEETCPDPKTVIAYARHELSQEDIERYDDHILTCPTCLELFCEIKLAEMESAGQRPIDPTILEKALAALK